MTIEIATLISVLSLLFAAYTGIKGAKRADISDIEKRAAETATLNVKLDTIGSDVRDIKYDITTVKKDVKNLSDRMIVVEQSTKSAHHRLDGLEGKGERHERLEKVGQSGRSQGN